MVVDVEGGILDTTLCTSVDGDSVMFTDGLLIIPSFGSPVRAVTGITADIMLCARDDEDGTTAKGWLGPLVDAAGAEDDVIADITLCTRVDEDGITATDGLSG